MRKSKRIFSSMKSQLVGMLNVSSSFQETPMSSNVSSSKSTINIHGYLNMRVFFERTETKLFQVCEVYIYLSKYNYFHSETCSNHSPAFHFFKNSEILGFKNSVRTWHQSALLKTHLTQNGHLKSKKSCS